MITISINDEDAKVFLELIRSIIREELSAVRQVELKEKLYSPIEACKVFHPSISKVTLHKWTKDGRLTKQKIGGRVYYKYSELLEAGAKLKRYKK